MAQVRQFKDLGIKKVEQGFSGDKIKIDRILNREITVHKFKIKESKYKEKGNGKCLYLQIVVGEHNHVVFTGSGVLMEKIEMVSKTDFPFTAKIVKDNERYEFI